MADGPSAYARFRAWLKSDMPVLRWVLLGAYVVATGIPPALSLRHGEEAGGVLDLILLGCLAVFLLGGGIRRLNSPIPWWRLWMPIGVSVFGLTILFFGLCAALSDLFDHHPILSHLFHEDNLGPALAAWSACWALWLWVRGYRRPRVTLMWRLTGLVLAASLIELAAAIPALTYIQRYRTGLLVGLHALVGVWLGLLVLSFPLGTAIALIFLRPRRRREAAEHLSAIEPGQGLASEARRADRV